MNTLFSNIINKEDVPIKSIDLNKNIDTEFNYVCYNFSRNTIKCTGKVLGKISHTLEILLSMLINEIDHYKSTKSLNSETDYIIFVDFITSKENYLIVDLIKKNNIKIIIPNIPQYYFNKYIDNYSTKYNIKFNDSFVYAINIFFSIIITKITYLYSVTKIPYKLRWRTIVNPDIYDIYTILMVMLCMDNDNKKYNIQYTTIHTESYLTFKMISDQNYNKFIDKSYKKPLKEFVYCDSNTKNPVLDFSNKVIVHNIINVIDNTNNNNYVNKAMLYQLCNYLNINNLCTQIQIFLDKYINKLANINNINEPIFNMVSELYTNIVDQEWINYSTNINYTNFDLNNDFNCWINYFIVRFVSVVAYHLYACKWYKNLWVKYKMWEYGSYIQVNKYNSPITKKQLDKLLVYLFPNLNIDKFLSIKNTKGKSQSKKVKSLPKKVKSLPKKNKIIKNKKINLSDSEDDSLTI
jgi:hypothetical protein